MSSINLNFLLKAIIIVMLHLRIGDANNASCIEEERQALLNIKHAFFDHYGRLSSWGSLDCCHWSGVFCHHQSSHVQMLDLHGYDYKEGFKPLRGEISPSLMELPNLNYLNLSFNDFNKSEIPKFLGSLSKLRCLDLYGSSFGGEIPIGLGKLSNLQVLNLSYNSLVGNIPFQLGNLSSLQELNLHFNNLVGNIPYQLGNLSRLEILWIGYNDDLKIDDRGRGGFDWLSNLQSLTSLDLSYVSNLNYSNNLLPIIGKLPTLKELWLSNCSLTDINILSTPPSHLNFSTSLVTLDLNDNKLTSSIFPWLFNLSSNLATLYLYHNHLSGPLPDDFGKNMNSLVNLDLSYNDLKGTISDVHFDNLTRLQSLDLSGNLLTLKFSNNWNAPFQLQYLWLIYCKLGPGFPIWLHNQKNLQHLYISHAEINDSIPNWFWRLVEGANSLQIESSNLKGDIPDLSLEFVVPTISLAHNQIEGSVPLFLLNIEFVDLSGNQISKFVPSCGKNAIVENLIALNLSSNHLSGELLDCWDHFKSLKSLDLSNNKLSGRIPDSMASLSQLVQLILRNNCLSSGLPSLKNVTELKMLDLGENSLSGPIPTSWTRNNLKKLETLSLRMNKLDGKLPFHVCYLTNVRVLDLSFNKFTGSIPSCFDKLVAMTQKHVRNDSMRLIRYYKNGEYVAGIIFDWYLCMVWKGRERVYNDIYGLVSIDLSHNQLVGEMPTGIGKLVELRFLNLSANKLSGQIILEIGHLKSLEALDLSGNYFYGEIPSSLAEISSLSVLDLSNNNLFGKIPVGTQLQSFDGSSYKGNPYLCGRPLDMLCSSEDHPSGNGMQANQVVDEDHPFTKAFYEILGVGFAFGFWIVFGSLLVIRSSRHAYFNFLNNLADSIYVTTLLFLARWRRWLRK